MTNRRPDSPLAETGPEIEEYIISLMMMESVKLAVSQVSAQCINLNRLSPHVAHFCIAGKVKCRNRNNNIRGNQQRPF